MSSDGPVSHWLDQLKGGDAASVQRLWELYFPRLIELARLKLQRAPGGAADAEDVALSAFASFCRNAQHGRFPELLDRDGLWRLLVVITARKAARLVRDERAQKRGGADRAVGAVDLAELLSREPTPDFAAQVAEECQCLLRRLGDRELEAVALLRMEGYTVKEIADRLGYAPRSIKRKLRLIRNVWEMEPGS